MFKPDITKPLVELEAKMDFYLSAQDFSEVKIAFEKLTNRADTEDQPLLSSQALKTAEKKLQLKLPKLSKRYCNIITHVKYSMNHAHH